MINLEEFAGGALAEKFNIGLKEVLENITDPNTNHATKRKLTIDLTFTSDEAREFDCWLFCDWLQKSSDYGCIF